MIDYKKRNKKIGIFDSGFGGLDILKEITKTLGQYEYIYLGDTARTPYGTRSKKIIYNFSLEAVDFLFKKNCELIIIACNTASCEALRQIQQKYLPKKYPDRRVLGMIIPTAEEVAQITKNNRVGIIATPSTVRSGAFIRELNKINPELQIWQNAAPRLVPIIEAGGQETKKIDFILREYLKPLLSQNIDTLVLGCTHYSIVKKRIKQIVGKNIKIVSEAPIIADKLKKYLIKHKEIENKLSKKIKINFYTTDLSDNFEKLGSKIFKSKIKATKINLDAQI